MRPLPLTAATVGPIARACALTALLASLAWSPAAQAEDDKNPPLPTGADITPVRPRPSSAEAPLSACSFHEPVCVHAPKGAPPWTITATLRRAEDILRAHRALNLPIPMPDGDLGGNSNFDIYLHGSWQTNAARPPWTSIDFNNLAGPFDRTSAFAVLPAPSPRDSCVDRAELARAIAHAALMRLDAGAEPGAVAAASSYVASLTAPCDLAEIQAVDDTQRAPEISIMAVDADNPAGCPLFPWYLDAAYGTGRPAAVMLGLLAVAAQRTPAGSMQWKNEPDTFDALRASLKARSLNLEDLLLDFAVARAFVGSRSDEAHLDDAARFGDLGRVRFEWAIPAASLPRRLAPLRAVEPTGSTYIWVDLEGSTDIKDLTFVADWELPAVFRWAAVKVDRTGAEVGRVNVATIHGASHAERSIVGVEGLAGVVIVGVNAGSMNRSRPFDPDETPVTAHAYTVTLYK